MPDNVNVTASEVDVERMRSRAVSVIQGAHDNQWTTSASAASIASDVLALLALLERERAGNAELRRDLSMIRTTVSSLSTNARELANTASELHDAMKERAHA